MSIEMLAFKYQHVRSNEETRYMIRNLLGKTIVFGSAIAVSNGAFAADTLQTVKDRGSLICGVGDRPGFSALDSRGEWQGMDVDTCRAVAAATLGDKTKTQFIKTTTQNRFTTLQSNEIDLLTKNVTWTVSRDTEVGVDFVSPTFYDGQAFMVPTALGVTDVTQLDGATVCVLPGSTSEKVAHDVFEEHGMTYTPVVIENQAELNTAYFSGRCDVHIQSVSGLSSTRATVASNPDDYVILPGVYGKDPMGPVVRQDDPRWKDIVAWTVYAMFQAEESGVTSENVDEMLKSDDATVQRLFGVSGNVGQGMGLSNDWAYLVIKQVGNYGEVFERNVGMKSPLKLERGLNALWVNGGLIYAPPFK
ncbi:MULTISPECIES: amino acid ABC transporter substrate-binding protein [unclassified Aurantimonas]|uniref:amino acid ABC transporter substrate-binding protein n=1 Tax=unclassified Aurantimonas TaxID=2638230 RepID=UPI002E1912D8|nr:MULTISPECIES: amino acid ABC transporter substrate-binding protein [unclassified Aurantimonas]MEC5292798.1 amino acid ABC transporter substrate-binding protein [Aurantimonas sp. C2-3-R2]MEC5413850.1 amino acid ABC transporter substrate-binding protein [Aurantimonas sp. C2-4-R8]